MQMGEVAIFHSIFEASTSWQQPGIPKDASTSTSARATALMTGQCAIREEGESSGHENLQLFNKHLTNSELRTLQSASFG